MLASRSRSSPGESCGARRFQKFFRVFTDVTFRENRVTGDQQFRPRAHYITDGIECHPAIHFDTERKAKRFADFHKSFDLPESARNKFLRPESRIYGHHQNVVNQIQDFIHHVHRRGGIQHHA